MQGGRKTRNSIIKLFRYAGYILFRPLWCMERLVPRSRRIWIFGAWYGQKYSDNSKWLYEYVILHCPEIKAVWITKNDSVYNLLKKQEKCVFKSGSFGGIWHCLRAKYAFLSSGTLDVNAFFLNGTRQIWLWHGMPLKKIGFCDEMGVLHSKTRLFVSRVLNPYFSLSPWCTLASADFFVPFLKASFRLPEERIWKTGLPRCDAFFAGRKERLAAELRRKFPGAAVFVYMPTFRMTGNMDGVPFQPFSETFGFSKTEFVRFLEERNIVFLYKPHFVDSAVKVHIESERFMYLSDSDFDDLYTMLDSIDMLATDYSSVYFDFLAAKKNVFLLVFDYEEYTKNSRAHFFDMRTEMHGVFCEDWHDFYKKFSCEQNPQLESDRLKFAEYLDGMCCKKIIDRIKKN